MTKEIYLTDEIIIYEGKYYKKKINNKNLITIKNWQKHLSDCGWLKLELAWVRRLNKYSTIKNKTSCWGILDCESNGDCFYSVISEALNYHNRNIENLIHYDSIDIRKKISNQINKDNFEEIMNVYKIEKELSEFKHSWDINLVKNYKDLRNELIKEGNNYWADFLIIELFKNEFNMNLIILNDYNNNNKCELYSIGDNLDKLKETIIIYYQDQTHFQLIGYFINNQIKKIFKYDEIPEEIIKIYTIDCRKNVNY